MERSGKLIEIALLLMSAVAIGLSVWVSFR
jgi:hypothetical protein